MSQTVFDLARSLEGATPAQIRAEYKRQTALGYRLFAAMRWGDMGDGHITARDPERPDCFWLLRLGVPYNNATVHDLLLVGPDGSLVEGDGIINPAAYHIHHPLLAARPDVVSAAHVHTPWGTPFSAEVRLVEPVTQESCYWFERHTIFDDEEVDILDVDGGKRIAAALGDLPAIVLRNHGLLTVGVEPADAVGSFVHFERVAEANLKARDAKPISAEAARHARRGLGDGTSGSYWFWWLVGRHIPDPTVVE